jgi:hypothetical protein
MYDVSEEWIGTPSKAGPSLREREMRNPDAVREARMIRPGMSLAVGCESACRKRTGEWLDQG